MVIAAIICALSLLQEVHLVLLTLTPCWAPEASGTALQPCTPSSGKGFDISHPASHGDATQDPTSWLGPAPSGAGSGEGGTGCRDSR